jgi:hypothetical protein
MAGVTVSPPESFKGWTAFLRDRTTRRVVSSQPVLEDGNASVSWLQEGILLGRSSPTLLGKAGYDIVLSPPPSALGVPEFADTYLGLSQEPFPQLPKPVTMSGTVRTPAGKAVSASLHFVSTSLNNILPSLPCAVHNTDASLLHYDAVVSTDSAGVYGIVLPPGQYTITVDPDPASGFAKTQANPPAPNLSTVFPPINLPTSDPCTKTQDTYDFRVEPLLEVAGRVTIADDRPLANATVEFSPSVSLLTLPPASVTSQYPWPPPTPTQLAQVDWPRPFQVVTGDDGSFTASVDPGAYDITVRPVDGTRLPWIVSPANLATGGQVFSASTKTETPIQLPRFWIPAPSAIDLTLHDQPGNPIAEALVRAYSFTSCTIPVGDTSCNGFALQIGQAFTDGNGSFEMFLTPVPFTPQVK